MTRAPTGGAVSSSGDASDAPCAGTGVGCNMGCMLHVRLLVGIALP
jgi:hypothetical protein